MTHTVTVHCCLSTKRPSMYFQHTACINRYAFWHYKSIISDILRLDERAENQMWIIDMSNIQACMHKYNMKMYFLDVSQWTPNEHRKVVWRYFFSRPVNCEVIACRLRGLFNRCSHRIIGCPNVLRLCMSHLSVSACFPVQQMQVITIKICCITKDLHITDARMS